MEKGEDIELKPVEKKWEQTTLGQKPTKDKFTGKNAPTELFTVDRFSSDKNYNDKLINKFNKIIQTLDDVYKYAYYNDEQIDKLTKNMEAQKRELEDKITQSVEKLSSDLINKFDTSKLKSEIKQSVDQELAKIREELRKLQGQGGITGEAIVEAIREYIKSNPKDVKLFVEPSDLKRQLETLKLELNTEISKVRPEKMDINKIIRDTLKTLSDEQKGLIVAEVTKQIDQKYKNLNAKFIEGLAGIEGNKRMLDDLQKRLETLHNTIYGKIIQGKPTEGITNQINKIQAELKENRLNKGNFDQLLKQVAILETQVHLPTLNEFKKLYDAKIQRLEEQLKQANVMPAQIKELTEKLNTDYDLHNTDIKNLQTEMDKLKEEIKKLVISPINKEEILKELDSFKTEMKKSMDTIIGELKQRIEKLEQQSGSTADIEELKKQLAELSIDISINSLNVDKLIELQIRVTKLEEQIKNLQSQPQPQQQQREIIDGILKQIFDINTILQTILKNINDNTAKQNELIKGTNEEIKNIKESLNKIDNLVPREEYDELIKDLYEEFEEIQDQFEELNKLKDCCNKIEELTNRVLMTETGIKKLEEVVNDIKNIDIKHINKQLEYIMNENKQLQEKVAALEEKYQEYGAQLSEKGVNVEELIKQNAELLDRNNKNDQRLQELLMQLRKLNVAKINFGDLYIPINPNNPESKELLRQSGIII